MQKNLVFALCGCLLYIGAYAQSNGIEGILRGVEENNKELQAFLNFIESRKLELKSSNNLSDPQLGAYYLPWGDNNTSSYLEIQISQTTEFPTVYGAKNKLIESQYQQLDMDYALKRQSILKEAQTLCFELIYLNKRKSKEQERLELSERVFEQTEELFTNEEKSALDFNKAKVVWLQQQFEVQQIESEIQNTLLSIKNLNGGIDISWDLSTYPIELFVTDRDSIWQEKLARDPEFQLLRQEELLARKSLVVAKSNSLPDLTIGYNYQGIPGSSYAGVYGGVSIPIWSNKNKVRAAKFNVQFQSENGEVSKSRIRFAFDMQYNDYEMLLFKYTEYKKTLDVLNSDEMLLQAYQLGEFSFLEYHRELVFYYQAYDSMLRVENQLQLAKSQLLMHRL
jgi:outer membrane protein, heavy metal efflux system